MATYWENSCSFGLRYVSWCRCLIVSLVFSHLGFWSGNLFLIAPFPDLCLLVPFYVEAEEPSLYLRREKLALQYAIRIAANPSNPVHKVSFPPYISEEVVQLYESKPKAISGPLVYGLHHF